MHHRTDLLGVVALPLPAARAPGGAGARFSVGVLRSFAAHPLLPGALPIGRGSARLGVGRSTGRRSGSPGSVGGGRWSGSGLVVVPSRHLAPIRGVPVGRLPGLLQGVRVGAVPRAFRPTASAREGSPGRAPLAREVAASGRSGPGPDRPPSSPPSVRHHRLRRSSGPSCRPSGHLPAAECAPPGGVVPPVGGETMPSRGDPDYPAAVLRPSEPCTLLRCFSSAAAFGKFSSQLSQWFFSSFGCIYVPPSWFRWGTPAAPRGDPEGRDSGRPVPKRFPGRCHPVGRATRREPPSSEAMVRSPSHSSGANDRRSGIFGR